MDAAGQHSMITPTTCFTAACVVFSIVAIMTVWRAQNAPEMPESKAELSRQQTLPRPQPRRRIAVDSLYIQSSDGLYMDLETSLRQHATEQDTPMKIISNLLSNASQLAQRLSSLHCGTSLHATIASLLGELSHISTGLCRLQHAVKSDGRALHKQPGLDVCFTATASGLSATFRLLHCMEYDSLSNTSIDVLREVLQQLKDQRVSLSFLAEGLTGCSLPPTPPAESEMDGQASTEQSSRDYLGLPQPSNILTGLTPAVDAKGWIEPPPEYSPPAKGSAYVAAEKGDSKDSSLGDPVQHPEEELGGRDTEAMYHAVTDSDIVALSKYLSDGEDPNATTGDLQRAPLHQAAHLNHCSCLSTLLIHGAIMSTEDVKGDTPLHLAAWAGHVEALSVLLAHGADVDWLSGRDGYSPLWCAISAYHIDAARLLLKHGARVSLRSTSGGGLLPLHQAAVTGQSAMCELLLERGAQVDGMDDDSSTALHYAAASGSPAAVKVLLKAKADVERKQAQGLTPAHWAAHKGHTEVLGLLLDHGAPVNATTDDCAAPLHLAANRGHLPAVRLLLERGARSDLVARSWDGVEGTAIDMASAKRHARVARLIQKWASAA